MTIDEQLREMARRADEHQRAITVEEIMLRASGPDDADALVDLASVRRWRRPPVWLAVAAVMALLALVGVLAVLDQDQTVDTTPITDPTTTTAPPIWSGPELDRGTVVLPMADLPSGEPGVHEFSSQDPIDAAVASVDVTRVRSLEPHPGGMNGYWSLDLAAMPPRPIDLEPGMIVTYGIAFDTDADGVADYTAGIDNDAPVRGDFRAWVTDLATGETREQVGPPYGFPIEFNHTSDGGCTVSDEEPNCGVDLMFLGDDGRSAPAGLNPETARFYVWTAVTRDGVLVANDYVPDAGWMSSG